MATEDKKIITVTSDSGLKNAIDEDYDIIIIGGEYAQQVAGKLRSNKNWDSLSNLAIVTGIFFFAPALVAGVAGKIFTNKLKKYKIAEMDEEFVTLKKKKK